MTDNEKKTLSLGGSKGTLSLKGGAPGQQHITQTLARGQSRGVTIEVRKKRGAGAQTNSSGDEASTNPDDHLTNDEREVRLRALQKAKEDDEKRREEEAKRRALEAEEEKLRQEAEKTGKRPRKLMRKTFAAANLKN
jgi:translation initiation factor IF-2